MHKNKLLSLVFKKIVTITQIKLFIINLGGSNNIIDSFYHGFFIHIFYPLLNNICFQYDLNKEKIICLFFHIHVGL